MDSGIYSDYYVIWWNWKWIIFGLCTQSGNCVYFPRLQIFSEWRFFFMCCVMGMVDVTSWLCHMPGCYVHLVSIHYTFFYLNNKKAIIWTIIWIAMNRSVHNSWQGSEKGKIGHRDPVMPHQYVCTYQEMRRSGIEALICIIFKIFVDF